MSRDAFPHVPQDDRDEELRASARRRSASPPRSDDERGRAGDAGAESSTLEIPHAPQSARDREDSPRALYIRDRAYLLRESELHSLGEIGMFRVVTITDLAKFAYGGDRERMERDIRHLRRERLVSATTLEISRGKSLRVVTLTKTGHHLLKNAGRLPQDQAVYHGLRKPREAQHDVDLYRVYQKEASRIEKAGGRPLRVILDYQLKESVNRDLARAALANESPTRKQEIADKHALPLVNGKIQLPDLRIEYENAEGELRHIDLELVTRQYRPRGVSAKAASGFSLYARNEDVSRLRRILDEREITAGIFTL